MKHGCYYLDTSKLSKEQAAAVHKGGMVSVGKAMNKSKVMMEETEAGSIHKEDSYGE